MTPNVKLSESRNPLHDEGANELSLTCAASELSRGRSACAPRINKPTTARNLGLAYLPGEVELYLRIVADVSVKETFCRAVRADVRVSISFLKGQPSRTRTYEMHRG